MGLPERPIAARAEPAPVALHNQGRATVRSYPHPLCKRGVSTLLDKLCDQLGQALLRRVKERVLAAVLAQRRLHSFLLGTV